MRWMTAPARDFAQGHGPWVVLVDRSASIPRHTQAVISYAVKALMIQHPGIRAFGFAWSVEEVDGKRNLDIGNCHPSAGSGTSIGNALQYVSALNPRRVSLFADGEDLNKSRSLRIAEQMTGEIDCYFCEPSFELFQYDEDFDNSPQGIHFGSRERHYRHYTKGVDPAFLQQLARKGRGNFARFQPNPRRPFWDWHDSTRLEGILRQSTQRRPMSNRYNVRPDTYHVHAPGAEHREIVKDVHLYHKTRYHHHYVDPEHVEHGAPKQAEITVERTQGRITIGTILKMAWHGPNYQQAINRGALTSAPSQQALAAPNGNLAIARK